jgi:hypothetical protein
VLDEFVIGDGLLCHGPDPVDLFRRAASYVDRILRGAKPGDRPVQLPVKYEMGHHLQRVLLRRRQFADASFVTKICQPAQAFLAVQLVLATNRVVVQVENFRDLLAAHSVVEQQQCSLGASGASQPSHSAPA